MMRQPGPCEIAQLAPGVGGAIFSDCWKYRYTLWRDLSNKPGPTINFCLLNPSTATAEVSDATVTRCINRAKAMGARKVIVTNAFGLRSTDPGALLSADDPIGPGNNYAIAKAARESEMTICGWGKLAGKRGRAVEAMLREAVGDYRIHFLKLNQDGSPRHPLYIPMSCEPQPWSPTP